MARRQEGQTLVELAIVLPCFCLGVFMAVQLMVYCHNMVELQRMSQVAMDRISIENYKDAFKHYWFHSLYGVVTPPRDIPKSEPLSPWRPFIGITTVKDAGIIAHITVKSNLLTGNGFRRVLANVSHSAQAVTLLEPAVAQEN